MVHRLSKKIWWDVTTQMHTVLSMHTKCSLSSSIQRTVVLKKKGGGQKSINIAIKYAAVREDLVENV